jgi:hypothetical protein
MCDQDLSRRSSSAQGESWSTLFRRRISGVGDEVPEQRILIRRERVTNWLALAIVSSTIFSVLWSFRYVSDPDQMDNAKTVIAAMSGLAGVVIGYYFGRGPGEARASQANDQIEQMRGGMREAGGKVEQLAYRAASGERITHQDLQDVRRTMRLN